MKTTMITAALAMAVAVPAVAQPFRSPTSGFQTVQYQNRDRDYVDRNEVIRSRERVQEERQDYRQALRNGDPRDIREERRDLNRAEREFRQDARDWQRGRRYSWNRPDPRYNGYYADNYYRSGNYRPYTLRRDDRVYRGRDGRFYCRRNDGTTGLIVGALGGGVLGNVIAPGGSKTLGSILGGGLGAALGSSIDRGQVTCR